MEMKKGTELTQHKTTAIPIHCAAASSNDNDKNDIPRRAVSLSVTETRKAQVQEVTPQQQLYDSSFYY
jgi:hypothetical protein